MTQTQLLLMTTCMNFWSVMVLKENAGNPKELTYVLLHPCGEEEMAAQFKKVFQSRRAELHVT